MRLNSPICVLYTFLQVMKNVSLTALLVFATTLLLASCVSLKEPEFRRIENARMGDFSFSEVTAHFDLGFHNPNKARLKFKNAAGKVWVDGVQLGDFSIDTLVKIDGYSDFILPVALKLKVDKTVTGSLSALMTKEVNVKIEGEARVGKGMIFINHPISYEGKQRLSELLK